jgi:hypothetical protein
MAELELKELIPVPETFGLGQRAWETYNFSFGPGMEREHLDYLLELKSQPLERRGHRLSRSEPNSDQREGINFVLEFIFPSDKASSEAKVLFSSAWWAGTQIAIVALVSEIRETMREQIAGNFGFEERAGNLRAYRI